MIKATLLFAGLLALAAAAVLHVDENTTSEDSNESNEVGCLYENQLWGSEDGTKFYFCIPGTNTAIEQDCPPEKFFVRNATTTGCVSMALMDPHCINTLESAPGPCTGDNLRQPQPSIDTNKFYVCPTENEDAILLPCPDGKAFVKQDGYLGCFEWQQWRSLRECPV